VSERVERHEISTTVQACRDRDDADRAMPL